MTSHTRSIPRKSRRPRPGAGFALLRGAGWFFKIAGLLLVGLALLGFIYVLVKTWPTFFEALRNIEQKMAGFFFFIVLGNLLVFIILGFAGAVLAVIGFALGYWGTQPDITPAETEAASVSTAQSRDHQQPPGAS